ncbi:MAG: hypothetical protein V7707_00950 [Motiliproteus sp.]
MRPEEIINARIESLHTGVNSAVQRPDGAQFALMLSMISASQEWAQQLAAKADDGVEDSAAWDRNDLYTPEMVGQMAGALQDGRIGDLQMWVSWLETVPPGLIRRRLTDASANPQNESVPLSQAAVLAKRYHMVDEVKQSRVKIAA